MKIALSILIGILAFSLPVQVQAQSHKLEGPWRGGGHFKPKSGSRETVKCRVSYSKITDKIFSVSGICANASSTVRQSGEILKVGRNSYVGDFKNMNFDVSGRIRVKVNGSRQTMTLISESVTGSLSLSR